jgi:hypothetical protein
MNQDALPILCISDRLIMGGALEGLIFKTTMPSSDQYDYSSFRLGTLGMDTVGALGAEIDLTTRYCGYFYGNVHGDGQGHLSYGCCNYPQDDKGTYPQRTNAR